MLLPESARARVRRAHCRPKSCFFSFCMYVLMYVGLGRGVYAPTMIIALIYTHPGPYPFLYNVIPLVLRFGLARCKCVWRLLTGFGSLKPPFLSWLRARMGKAPLMSMWEGLWLPHPSARLWIDIYFVNHLRSCPIIFEWGKNYLWKKNVKFIKPF